MALNLKTILKIEMRVAFLTKSSDASYPSLRRVTTFISFIDIFKVYCVVALSAMYQIIGKKSWSGLVKMVHASVGKSETLGIKSATISEESR